MEKITERIDRHLDLQLKKHAHQLIIIGLIAHTCIEPPSVMPPSSATRSPW